MDKGNRGIILVQTNLRIVIKSLIISNRKGSFPGMLAAMKFNIVIVAKNKAAGTNIAEEYDKVVNYSGGKVAIKL
jgi:alpha-D-xyloside xylohydrolase